MTQLLTAQTWRLADHGLLDGALSMGADVKALEQMNAGALVQPKIRFFQWLQPTVSFGHLLDEAKVRAWLPSIEAVRRPTGGGAVFHQTSDLSFSVLWPRGRGFLPERPRACYQAIHEKLLAALTKWDPDLLLSLHVSCGTAPAARAEIAVCFNEPVCNDVMAGGVKMAGGALRIMRGAILYQGNILLQPGMDLVKLKSAIADEFC